MITLTRLTSMDALRYGRLEIIGKAASRNGQVYMLCRCDCGKEKEIALSSLKRGLTQSCGCYRKEKGPGNQRHGLHASRTYKAWLSMRQRCLNPNNPAYKNYGGRGITIDPRWNTFDQFLADMDQAPDGMSIERIDNEKGYGPDNCKWASRIEQGRNTRKCRVITHDGKTQTLAEWADQYGINRQTLGKRLDNGWDMERALTQSPLQYHNRQPS
jgi:hypothetical protein